MNILHMFAKHSKNFLFFVLLFKFCKTHLPKRFSDVVSVSLSLTICFFGGLGIPPVSREDNFSPSKVVF